MGPETQNRATKTLGDVLYAGKSAVRVPENYWTLLLSSIAGGDQLALHALYVQSHRIVYTLALRITGDRETAEEVTVDVFYDVWRKAATYDAGEASVLGWILSQARSRAIDRMRFDRRKKRAGAAPPPMTEAGLETGEAREAALLLKRALAALTPEEREAIETAFFSERTHLEAAEALNVPLGTVKTRIRSGLSKLRESLSEIGDRG